MAIALRSLVLAALASATGLAEANKVALTDGVVRVPKLVAELAQKSGRTLRCSADVSNDVLYIHLGSREPGELMALIAEADGAEWEKHGEEVILARPAELLRKQELATQATLSADIAAEIDRLKPKLEPLPGDITAKLEQLRLDLQKATTQDANFAGRRRLVPATRLLMRLLDEKAAAEFAKIPPGQIAYFVSGARGKEKTFPGPVAAAVKDYVREINGLVSSLTGGTDSQRIEAAYGMGLFITQPSRLDSEPLLVLKVDHSDVRSFALSLDIYDASGARRDSALDGIVIRDAVKADALPGYDKWSKEQIRPDPQTQALINARNGTRSAEMIRTVADPQTTEPIDLMLGKVLPQLQGSMQIDVIAALPDEGAILAFNGLPESPTKGRLADRLAMLENWEVRDGLAIGKSRYPALSRSLRADRAALAGFLGKLIHPVPLDLDEIAAYAKSQSEGAWLSGLEPLWLSVLGHGDPNDPVHLDLEVRRGSRDALRLYANLTPEQRQAVWSSQVVPMRNVVPAARQFADTWAYTRETTLLSVGANPQNYGSCPTLLAPMGLPGDAVLSPKAASDPVVFAVDNGALRFPMDPSFVGMVIARQERGEALDAASGYPNYLQQPVVGGKSRLLFMRLALSDQLQIEARLYDYSLVAGTAPGSWEKLPMAYREEVQHMLDSERKKAAGGTGRPPPPN